MHQQPYTIYMLKHCVVDRTLSEGRTTTLQKDQQEVCGLEGFVGLATVPTLYQTGKCRAHKADESYTMYHESCTKYHVSSVIYHIPYTQCGTNRLPGEIVDSLVTHKVTNLAATGNITDAVHLKVLN